MTTPQGFVVACRDCGQDIVLVQILPEILSAGQRRKRIPLELDYDPAAPPVVNGNPVVASHALSAGRTQCRPLHARRRRPRAQRVPGAHPLRDLPRAADACSSPGGLGMSIPRPRYAEGTTVSPERSQAEIAEQLRRYGASSYVSGYEDNRAMIAFRAHDRTVRFLLDLPLPDDREFAVTPTGLRRKPDAQAAAYEAEVRRRWRALALAIKAKLEAVATGIASFEDEFLAYTLLPDNTTVGDRVRDEIAAAWSSGVPPRRLLQIGS